MLPVFICAGAVTLLWQESAHPLRPVLERKIRHNMRNIGVALLSAITLRFTERPLTQLLTGMVKKHNIGILPALKLSGRLEAIAGFLLLDYSLYLWHRLNHQSSFFWRFHEVHHEDIDLTMTTGLRFHFLEMAMSSIWRASQILLIGPGKDVLKLWQNITFMEILFHHSNIRLPLRLENFLVKLVVTPRMHTIHHSLKMRETNSNWSSCLTIWDVLHGTLKLDVPQENIIIGVPAYRKKDDLKFTQLIGKPFLPQKSSWSVNGTY